MSMKRKTKKRAQSVLGLTLIGSELRAAHVILTKGGTEVVKAASAVLSLDLMHREPELIGREIKNHLDEAGIRERRCVLGLPPRWVMSQHTKVPELSPEDTVGFLQLEAEKGFPVDPGHLQISQSFQQSTAGAFVTQLAVRKEQIEQLGAVLKAAGLKPVSFSLGLAMLPQAIPPAGSGGRITVSVEPTGVTVLISAGGGIAAFRTCEASIDSEAGEKIVNGSSVARELRITLEQVPAELRTEIRELCLLGETTMVRQLTENLGDWAKNAGLKITRGDLPEKNLAAEMAEKLAANWLQGDAPALEFLPPHPGRWTQLMARYNSKRLASAGFAAVGLALIVALAFGWLEVRRWLLRSEWSGMQAQVASLEAVKAKTNEYQPWYDTSFRTLTIIKRVTECFPDNGTVTAKSLEVHSSSITASSSSARENVSNVTISGTARDNASLLRMQELLRKAKEVQGLKIEQIRAKNPMQFTLTFRWNAPSGT